MVIGGIKRLSKVARDFNVGISTIVDFLHKKGFAIDTDPNNKITDDAYHLLEKEYKGDVSLKKESEKINLKIHRGAKESVSLDDVKDTSRRVEEDDYEDDEVIIKGNTSIRGRAFPIGMAMTGDKLMQESVSLESEHTISTSPPLNTVRAMAGRWLSIPARLLCCPFSTLSRFCSSAIEGMRSVSD